MLTGAPKNLEPVGHFGALSGHFGFCRRCGVSDGEQVPLALLGWYLDKN